MLTQPLLVLSMRGIIALDLIALDHIAGWISE